MCFKPRKPHINSISCYLEHRTVLLKILSQIQQTETGRFNMMED